MKHLLTIFLIVLLSACSDNSSTSDNKSNKTVIDSQIRALEKAKGVEEQVLDAAQQQRAVIDNQ